MAKTIVYRGGEAHAGDLMARPKGSKNKRSVGIPADLAEKLGHRDPAEVLGELYSMPHEQLKKMVRSAAGARAMALRMQAAVAAMPYKHSKMPVKMEVNEDQLPTLVIVSNANSMQNQQLIQKQAEAVRLEAVRQNSEVIEVKGESDAKAHD
jgi:hypothetical protein